MEKLTLVAGLALASTGLVSCASSITVNEPVRPPTMAFPIGHYSTSNGEWSLPAYDGTTRMPVRVREHTEWDERCQMWGIKDTLAWYDPAVTGDAHPDVIGTSFVVDKVDVFPIAEFLYNMEGRVGSEFRAIPSEDIFRDFEPHGIQYPFLRGFSSN